MQHGQQPEEAIRLSYVKKEEELGGILKSEIAIPFKKEMYQLTETYARFARQSGVEIRFRMRSDT